MTVRTESDKVRRGVAVWAVKQAVAVALFCAVGLLCAGRWDWDGAWALTGVLAAYFVFTLAFLVPGNPGLYAERSGLKKGTKKWDIALSMLVAYTPLWLCIAAGLDARHGWSRPLPIDMRLESLLASALGLGILSWAMMSNSFFAATVRIQADRGQTVVSTGPYRVIRHPGYTGSIVFYAGLAGITGSLWAFVVVAVFLIPLVIRTALEDAVLQRELPGYKDYCARTRFRLIPHIW
jgi:protein-S-isoprenylcysteine O-methyltransferase Ste14